MLGPTAANWYGLGPFIAAGRGAVPCGFRSGGAVAVRREDCTGRGRPLLTRLLGTGASGRRTCPSPTGRSPPCSPRSSSPTAGRSPSVRSAPPPSSAPARWRSSRTRTACPSTASRPTRRTRSARRATRCAPTSTIDEIVRVAVECGADAIYPGYGFLSENPLPRRGVRAPTASPSSARRPRRCTWPATRSRAITAAREAGLPDARQRAADHRPRRAGRGGRGHRLPGLRQGRRPAAAGAACAGSTTRSTLRESLEAAQREADAAFGDPTVYLEQAVVNPRHIEVQMLADSHRHGAAPLRARLLGAASPPEGRRDRAGAQPRPRDPRRDVRGRRALRASRSATSTPARSSSSSARTARYVFIEMNPRIQVEHTVTEEVTDIDLVVAADAHRVGRDLRRT